jgi:LPPG:FO 2-phospho-L-lactate transferase
VRGALAECAAPVIAVAPIIGGRAVKGPTAKLMRELGLEVSAGSVAWRYRDLIDGYIMDRVDAGQAADADVPVFLAETLMSTGEDKEALARAVMNAVSALSAGP